MSGTLELRDLRFLNAGDLEPLIQEEIEEWERGLAWDFVPNAVLVRRFADMRGLGGMALMAGGEVAAYGYTVVDEHKALIGDLYVRHAWRGTGAMPRLFKALLDDLMNTTLVRRVETQLMLGDQNTAAVLQRERFVRVHERILMICDASDSLPEGKKDQLHRFRIEPWGEQHLAAAAAMMVLVYDGHVDAQINDQYRSYDGVTEFLGNLLQFSGCGTFFPGASFAAVDLVTGWLGGMVLCAFVADDVAHITQVCVSPRARGTGLGYELLRRAVGAAREAGALRISLTVTTANAAALELYRRCGFQEMRRFYAYAWERY